MFGDSKKLKIAFDPSFIHDLPEGHRFPMEKYDLLPKQLIHEGTVDESNFFNPDQLAIEIAELAHTSGYLERLINLKLTPREQRVTGFPHSQTLVERELNIMEGTRKCAEYAIENGVGMNIAGGTHHAFSDRGEGFCLLNDQAIAAHWLLKSGHANRILIIDLDVHQGNGTAEIFNNEDRVFTFSMHGEHNYPLKKEVSNLDIALPDAIGDKDYLYLLEKHLDEIVDQINPNFIFYQCGVDILETDKLGRLNVSMQGCKKRDEIVISLVKELNCPLVCSMGGGYSREIKHIVEAHANTFRTVQNLLF